MRLVWKILLAIGAALVGIAAAIAYEANLAPSAPSAQDHGMSPEERCQHMPQHCAGTPVRDGKPEAPKPSEAPKPAFQLLRRFGALRPFASGVGGTSGNTLMRRGSIEAAWLDSLGRARS